MLQKCKRFGYFDFGTAFASIKATDAIGAFDKRKAYK